MIISYGACSPASSVRSGRASSSPPGEDSNATCPSASCSDSDHQPQSANRTSPASTHPRGVPSRWFAVRPGIQRASRSRHRAGRMASEVRRYRRTRVGTAGALLQVHAFQLWWWGGGSRSGAFTCVHGRLARVVNLTRGPLRTVVNGVERDGN